MGAEQRRRVMVVKQAAWPLVAGLIVVVGVAASRVQGQPTDDGSVATQDTTLAELSQQLKAAPKRFSDDSNRIDRFESLLARDTGRLASRLRDLSREKAQDEIYQLLEYHAQIEGIATGTRVGDLHVALGNRLKSLARATEHPEETYRDALANWQSPLKGAASLDLLSLLARGWVKDGKTAGDCLLLSAIGFHDAGRVIELQWAVDLAEQLGPKGVDTEIAKILLFINMRRHADARTAVSELLAHADGLPQAPSESLSQYRAGREFFPLAPSPAESPYVTVRDGMVQAQVHMVPLDRILDDLSQKLDLKFERVPTEPPRVVLSTDGEFIAASRFIDRLASAAHLASATHETAHNTIRFKPYIFSIYWWSDEKLRTAFAKPKRIPHITNNSENSIRVGHLIVDGYAIQPPYSIEAKGTIVYFNGVAVSDFSHQAGAKNGGLEKAVEPPPEGAAKSYQEVGAIVRSEWARLPADLPFDRKKALIIERLRREPFLKKVSDDGSGVMTTYMRPDGQEESYLWSLADPGRSAVEPNFAELAQSTAKQVRDCLQRGGLAYWIHDRALSLLNESDALRAILQTNYVLLHIQERRDLIQALLAIGWSNEQAGAILCNFGASQALEDDLCCGAIRVILDKFVKRRTESILRKEVRR